LAPEKAGEAAERPWIDEYKKAWAARTIPS